MAVFFSQAEYRSITPEFGPERKIWYNDHWQQGCVNFSSHNQGTHAPFGLCPLKKKLSIHIAVTDFSNWTSVKTIIFTGSIARSANCRYLIYSEAHFEVFRPAGATRCTDGGEIWHGGLRAKFHPHRCNDKGVGPPKLKFLLRFDRNLEYKRPAGAYPLRDFTKFAEFVPHFRMRWVLKFGWICSRVMELWGF